jgi:hypothetical protein
MLDHIEKSAFRRGEYVGHAAGVWLITRADGVWRLTRGARRGGWVARHASSRNFLFARTLSDMNDRLAAFARNAATRAAHTDEEG